MLARLHFVVRTDPDAPRATTTSPAIEARLAEATRTWSDDLHDALIEQLGEERGADLYRRYGDAFPPAYRDDFSPRVAVADIQRIERLDPTGDLDMSLYLPLESPAGQLAFKLLRSGEPILLSDVLPLLENMGVRVTDERPYEVRPLDAPPSGSTTSASTSAPMSSCKPIGCARSSRTPSRRRGAVRRERRLQPARPRAPSSRGSEVALLRAIAKYLRQAGSAFSQTYMEETLAAHPDIARLLVELFRLRFEPARREDARRRPTSSSARSRRGSTRSRASTRTASCAASSA